MMSTHTQTHTRTAPVPTMSINLDDQYPEFYSFPPFFTIQPVLATRQKQLGLWTQLIVDYHYSHKLPICVKHECPLWSNPEIQRALSKEDLEVVLDHLVQRGSAEWMDGSEDGPSQASSSTSNNHRTTLRILWRTPQELASDIYRWATTSGQLGSVVTLYELHSGEDSTGQSFSGLDEDLIRRALTILESQGKCTIFQGETSNEDGIKFH
jgi:ESCRT-II complex subunit VPS25